MRPTPLYLVAMLVLLFAAGCSDAPAPNGLLRVDTLDGVEHTVAADTPERGDQALEFLWRAPDEVTVHEGTEWANPSAIAMNEDYVAVLDPQLARVHLFTSDGERAGSFGEPGEGPGELQQPMSLGVQGDSILVGSMLSTPAFKWFGRDGSYLGIAGEPGAGMSAGGLLLPGSGIVRQVFDPESGSQGWEYLALDGERHPFELPADHPMQPHVIEGDEGCWRQGAAGPNLVQVDCTFPLMRIVDVSGEVIREHRIDREPQRTPASLIDEAMEVVESGMLASSEGVPPDLVREMIAQQVERMRTEYAWTPIIRSVLGSRSGHRIVIVEQLPDPLGGGPTTLHILDSEGRYLVRHTFDHPIGSVAVSDTRLLVMVEDETLGLRHMEAYRLP